MKRYINQVKGIFDNILNINMNLINRAFKIDLLNHIFQRKVTIKKKLRYFRLNQKIAIQYIFFTDRIFNEIYIRFLLLWKGVLNNKFKD